MAKASTSLRFPAWAGTAQELKDTIHALHERVMRDGRPSVMIRPLLAPARATSMDELASDLSEKEHFQIVLRIEDPDGQNLLVVLGPDLPAPAAPGDDESEEEATGNTITVVAATSAEARDLANQAMDVLRPGIPRWGELKRKGQMNILRLENLAGLVLVALGLVAGMIVVWPWGWFFGFFISLVLLLIGLEVVERLFPPFELHEGRPRWRRRWWPAALLVGIPLALSSVLRIFFGP